MQVRDVPVIKSFHRADLSQKLPPQHPHFTSKHVPSQQIICYFSQLAVMTLQHKVAQLSPF